MKNLLLLFVVICSTTFAQFAPVLGEDGCIAIPMDSPLFVAWAESGTVERGWMNSADTTLGKVTYGEVDFCYGQPDPAVLSLGDGGFATFEFSNTLFNGDGYDFAVFENGFDNYFLELAFVEVSSDGENFFRFPSQSVTDIQSQLESFDLLATESIHNLAGKYPAQWGTPFDLSDLVLDENLDVNNIRFIRIVDVVGCIDPLYGTTDSYGRIINDPWPTAFPSGGFDLDALGLIHQNSLELTEYPKLNLYPNPVSMSNMLYFESEYPISNCKLIDALGNRIQLPEGNQLRISDYCSHKGVYIVEFELNGILYHQKILVN